MNEPSVAYIITQLEKKGIIFPCLEISLRQQQEIKSLRLLEKREDYLSRYNLAIRYMILLLLDKGFDIVSNKVHSVFREFCCSIPGITNTKASKIIKARHNNKYNNQEVTDEIKANLNIILFNLKTKG